MGNLDKTAVLLVSLTVFFATLALITNLISIFSPGLPPNPWLLVVLLVSAMAGIAACLITERFIMRG